MPGLILACELGHTGRDFPVVKPVRSLHRDQSEPGLLVLLNFQSEAHSGFLFTVILQLASPSMETCGSSSVSILLAVSLHPLPCSSVHLPSFLSLFLHFHTTPQTPLSTSVSPFPPFTS